MPADNPDTGDGSEANQRTLGDQVTQEISSAFLTRAEHEPITQDGLGSPATKSQGSIHVISDGEIDKSESVSKPFTYSWSAALSPSWANRIHGFRKPKNKVNCYSGSLYDPLETVISKLRSTDFLCGTIGTLIIE